MTEAVVTRMRRLLALLRVARSWFSPHPDRDDAVSVEARPRDVQRWMRDVDDLDIGGGEPRHSGPDAP